jgi:hypothetical protein
MRKGLGQNMSVPYEEWKKTDMLERYAKCVPKIVEQYLKKLHMENLTVEEIKSYMADVTHVLRRGERDLQF